MKKISWEIVVAGLLFIGAAIYLLTLKMDTNERHEEEVHAEVHTEQNDADKQHTVVVNLENLKHLEKLKNLEKLNKLERLKELENILSEEENTEVSKALEEALEGLKVDLEKEGIVISVSNENLVIREEYGNLTEGNWSKVENGVYAYKTTFSNADIQSANIVMDGGHITVIGTDAEEGSFLLRASGDVRTADDLAEFYEIFANINSGEARFNVSREQSNGRRRAIQIEATLTLPNKCDLRAITDGGHLQIENIEGKQTIVTDGGHIQLGNLSGQIDAQTDGGHITANKIKGKLDMTTDGGHLTLNGGSGFAGMTTDGGHITLKEYTGGAKAKTSGGNINLNFIQVTENVVAWTSAGNVTVQIPVNSDVKVKAKGTNTYVNRAFEIRGDIGKKEINGTIGKGSYLIDLAAGHGNVYIKNDDR